MAYINPDIKSSYRQNDLGRTLYNTVLTMNPDVIIEFGTLHGYSAVCMAQALRDLDSDGMIYCYDIWESYPYNKASKSQTQKTIDNLGLTNYIILLKNDFYNWKFEQFDLLHFDISNHGSKLIDLEKIIRKDNSFGGTVLFEGGSKERDKVEWMKDYDAINNSNIDYITINEDFPSLSLLL